MDLEIERLLHLLRTKVLLLRLQGMEVGGYVKIQTGKYLNQKPKIKFKHLDKGNRYDET